MNEPTNPDITGWTPSTLSAAVNEAAARGGHTAPVISAGTARTVLDNTQAPRPAGEMAVIVKSAINAGRAIGADIDRIASDAEQQLAYLLHVDVAPDAGDEDVRVRFSRDGLLSLLNPDERARLAADLAETARDRSTRALRTGRAALVAAAREHRRQSRRRP